MEKKKWQFGVVTKISKKKKWKSERVKEATWEIILQKLRNEERKRSLIYKVLSKQQLIMRMWKI